ncbi:MULTISPECIES: hypothetical protein [Flavobacterium]|jgi:hypothetical protein|uniref:Uncharacterized protein n=1 Tax=Flavobacterium cupriresistens TaxID=2893885 RepID=A0ABU4R9L9_9FLAO|nr:MULTISPECIES: hypothetical protein [unclassified Flavobacterium]KLT70487.1 hypothetical protein AB674_07400 [Flavobacterium sp. ABG]MDX6189259.1 hypothetical protein [Flavobacterium sp. Fl-318]UFH41355.1 hypothetical protein LNP23_16240 [Flavobacterium sp. F-323]
MKNPSSKPNQLITREFAKELNSNYTHKRAKIIRKSTKKDDANAIWYSLEALESYIQYIKTQGVENGYDVDGIRFYFGVYPEDEKHGEKAGLTTLFLAPTGKKASSVSSANKMQGFASTVEEEESHDIESIQPMNYGNIGRPPSLTY